MSLIRNLLAIGGNVADIRNPAVWLVDNFVGRKTSAGERVSATSALTFSGYFNALRVISEDIGKLPFFLFRELQPRGKEKATENPIFKLLHESPNPEMSSMTFRETLNAHALSWGGGIAEIVRDGRGRATRMWPIHPSRVTIKRNKEQELVYDIRVNRSEFAVSRQAMSNQDLTVRLAAEDVFHIHGLGDNGISGYSVLQFASESFGLGLAAQRFGSSFFGHGTTLAGVLEHPNHLGNEAAENLRKSWNKRHQGSEEAHKIGILEEGMKYTQIGVPPNDAQFLETRNFQVEEVARWFRIPPHKIQHLANATFSNIEQQSLEYVTDTLMPWIIRWEHEVERKLLITEPDDLFAKIEVTALLRGDQAARSKFYKDMFSVGAMSSNDIRDKEDDNPIDGGDKYYVPRNFVTLEQAATIPTKPQSGSFGAILESYRPVFENSAERITNKESKALNRAIIKYKGKHSEFESWYMKFYNEQENYFYNCFAPIVKVVGDSIKKTDILLNSLLTFVEDYISKQKMMAMTFFNDKNVIVDRYEIVDHLFKDFINALEV